MYRPPLKRAALLCTASGSDAIVPTVPSAGLNPGGTAPMPDDNDWIRLMGSLESYRSEDKEIILPSPKC